MLQIGERQQGDRTYTPLTCYVCPQCKGELVIGEDEFTCPACSVCYPIVDGIPDFIPQDLSQSESPVLRGVAQIDRLAPIYETRLWYPLVLKLYGGWSSPSLQEIAHMLSEILASVHGRVLDVACGPATYGRRIASPAKTVFGIDVSMGMLRQGVAYIEREQIPNVYLARARVEALPFRPGTFDGVVCGGSLHLFADTVAALHEVGVTMKEGAPLAVMTFWAGDRGILRFSRIRAHVEGEHGVHVFELPELEGYLAEAGLTDFRPQAYGSLLVFGARRE
jgi:SAM-dependent methyltransferase